MMYRLSFTFSIFIAASAAADGPAGAWPETASDSAPTATNVPSTSVRLIDPESSFLCRFG